MQNVLIGGGSGLVGKRLSELLTERGYQVSILSRSKKKDLPYSVYVWDTKRDYIEPSAVENADYVINLAGAGIADALWTKSRKRLIINSRLETTGLLKKAIQDAKTPPKAFIAASAIGYYGNRGDELLTEKSAPGKSGFLAETTTQWEDAIMEIAEETDVRTVALRTGIVLSTQGGAMEKMLLSFKLRTGAYFGDGSQWYSWIHIDDLCQMFIHAIENENMEGVYNAVAPNPSTNKDLTYELKDALDIAALVVSAPKFALKMGMGEMSHVVLDSAKVSSAKIEDVGFEFGFSELSPALEDLLEKEI
ncbi:MAG: TIGR01777 family oxidoreductase [Saprospiraceae bacterium]